MRAHHRAAFRLCRGCDGDIGGGAEGRGLPRARLVGNRSGLHAQRAVRDSPHDGGIHHGRGGRNQARIREGGQQRPRDILVRPAQDVVPHALQQDRGHAGLQ